jgi:hypothetical protein
VRWLRGVAGTFAGYGVLALVLRFLAPATGEGMSYLIVSGAWIVAGSLLGGFVAAWIAGQKELAVAAGLGLLMVIAAWFSMHRSGQIEPGWYQIALAGCGPVAALTGAAIRMLVRRG